MKEEPREQVWNFLLIMMLTWTLQKVRQYLRTIFTRALWSQVGLFANRQVHSDTGGSMYGGVVIEVLEDVVSAINGMMSTPPRISYNISSSASARDLFQQMQGDTNSDIDCMLCISIFYNKQQRPSERHEPLLRTSALAHDYIHNELERPKHLSNLVCASRPLTKIGIYPLIMSILDMQLVTFEHGHKDLNKSDWFAMHHVDMADKPAMDMDMI